MKKPALVILVVFLLSIALGIRSQVVPDVQAVDQNVTKEQLITVVNACNRLLSDLAVERSLNFGSNVITVFTSHEGNSIKKYTDGKFMIISLPLIQPSDRAALCVYIENCNALHWRNIDKAVNAGRHAEARKICEVLLHFESCGGAVRDVLEKLLKVIKNLEEGQNVNENLKKYLELKEYYGVPMQRIDFAQVEKKQVTIVKNVLDVRLP